MMTSPPSARRSVASLALLLVATLAGCQRERPEGAGYRSAAVDRGDLAMTVTATGTLSAVTTVQVGSQVSGIIRALYADFNTPVRRGQLLAELDPTPFEAQVEQRRADLTQAEVQLRNAEIALRRQQRLQASGLAAEAELDAAQAAHDAAAAGVEQARAALSQSETNLSYTKIVCPIDGVVVSRQYDVGQTVAASFQAPTLFTIAQDLTKMQVQADVDQADIGRVAVGQEVHFTVDAYPEEEFAGHITQVRLNATVNQNVITYPVIVEVTNPELKLRPQMTADISVVVALVHDVLRLPNAALRFRPEEGSEGGSGGGPGEGRGAARPPGAGVAAGDERAARGGEGAPTASERPRGGRDAADARTVYLLADGAPRRATITVGISDGRFTEITGGELAAGAEVIVGKDTVRAPSGGGRAFGMRGF